VVSLVFGSGNLLWKFSDIFLGCAENKAQTEIMYFTKRVGTLHKVRFH